MRIDSLQRALAYDHERVHLVRDRESGLEAVIAIHSTALGPSLGGMRWRAYPGGVAEALDDALRLARAMSLKASAAGLDLGGGKAVVIDDGREELRADRLIAIAAEIERLGGAYITAEDIGTTTDDMDLVAQHTGHVVGCSAPEGISGDVSPATAVTVLGGIKAALAAIDGNDSLAGREVGVIGLGKVGERLAELLVADGARVVGFDPVGIEPAIRELGVEPLGGLEQLYGRQLDVIAPCAVGGMIDERIAAEVRCRVICGAANNPLTGPAVEAALAQRDVLYVPDFIANCGGVIHADAQRRPEAGPEWLEETLAQAGERARATLTEARESGRLPGELAEERAIARIVKAKQDQGGFR